MFEFIGAVLFTLGLFVIKDRLKKYTLRKKAG